MNAARRLRLLQQVALMEMLEEEKEYILFASTMSHLASGDSFSNITWDVRVPSYTISMFVPEVCQAIIDEYAVEVIACQTTPAEWKEMANEFLRRWNFPYACGALDGKHVVCKCPLKTGSTYHNY